MYLKIVKKADLRLSLLIFLPPKITPNTSKPLEVIDMFVIWIVVMVCLPMSKSTKPHMLIMCNFLYTNYTLMKLERTTLIGQMQPFLPFQKTQKVGGKKSGGRGGGNIFYQGHYNKETEYSQVQITVSQNQINCSCQNSYLTSGSLKTHLTVFLHTQVSG